MRVYHNNIWLSFLGNITVLRTGYSLSTVLASIPSVGTILKFKNMPASTTESTLIATLLRYSAIQ